MKKKILLLAFYVLGLIATIALIPVLPAKIPMHWNWKGEVNAWYPAWNIIWMALLPIVLFLLLEFLPRIDPRKSSWELHKKSYAIIQGVISFTFFLLNWVIIASSLNFLIRVDMFVFVLIGLLFIVLGNYMATFRHNYFVGIRTPWTLANEEVWRKTHRQGGPAFIIMGALMIVGSFIPNRVIGGIVSFSGFILIPWLVIYSYLIFRKLKE